MKSLNSGLIFVRHFVCPSSILSIKSNLLAFEDKRYCSTWPLSTNPGQCSIKPATICDYSSLFATVRHQLKLFESLYALFCYLRLYAICYSGFPDIRNQPIPCEGKLEELSLKIGTDSHIAYTSWIERSDLRLSQEKTPLLWIKNALYTIWSVAWAMEIISTTQTNSSINVLRSIW